MRPLFIALILLASSARADEPRQSIGKELNIDGPAIVMFWAPWCAPCRAELKSYRDFTAGAAPYPIYVAALDTPQSQRALLSEVPPTRQRIVDMPSTSFLPRLGAGASGLPMTIGIGAHGALCGQVKGVLRDAALKGLIARCRLPR